MNALTMYTFIECTQRGSKKPLYVLTMMNFIKTFAQLTEIRFFNQQHLKSYTIKMYHIFLYKADYCF